MVTVIKKESQVGPGKYDPATPKKIIKQPATGLPGTTVVNPKASGIISSLDQALADKGFKWSNVDSEEMKTISLIDTLSNSQLEVLAKILKNKNYTVKASAQYIKNLFASEPELIGIAANSNGNYNTLVSNLNKDILPGLAKGGGTD